MKNIVIYGFKSCGKTTWGQKLAAEMQRPFIDTDIEIEKAYGMTPRQIELTLGTEKLREVELGLLSQLQGIYSTVIATGGRTLTYPSADKLLGKHGILVFLNVGKEVIKERIFSQGELPSFLRCNDPYQRFEALFEERCKLFLAVADLTIAEPIDYKELLEHISYHYGK